ncbi:MAG: hypothetical protein QXN75_03330 [Thermoproteota archaeon]|nr:hypothetical protein [Candidatus Brockarchaeota archaeon]
MSFEREEGKKILFQFVEDHPEYTILSDPDLDGIFTAAILARVLKTDISRIQYPKHSEISSLRVMKSILIELPMTKGLTYVGNNVLIDHHESSPSIVLYNGATKINEAVFDSGFKSVSRLVYHVFEEDFKIDEDGLRLLDAIDQIDSGNIESEIADSLNKAFLLNSMKEKVREELTLTIYRMDWDSLFNWVNKELSKWSIVEDAIEKMKESVKTTGNITYFTYNVTDQVESAARRVLMLRLEESTRGVILCIGLRKGKPVSATIATRSSLNLNKVYEKLREREEIEAGGRENIGGIQFKTDLSLKDALSLIQDAVEKSLTNQS